MRLESEVKKWGNSLAVRITGTAAEISNLKEGTKIAIEVNKDSLIIKPQKKARKRLKLPYSEDQLVKGLSKSNSHSDLIAQPSSKEFGE